MRILKCIMICLLLSSFVGIDHLHAEEVKPPEAGTVPAPAPEVTGSASMAFLNRYIFRGYQIGKSGLVIQPSASISYKGFSFIYWGNFDTHQSNTTSATFAGEGQSGYNETDLTLSYTYQVGKLSLTGGYVHYELRYAKSTGEFFVTTACDVITKPTLSIYQDVSAYPGTYVNLSFAHSFNLPKDITLDLGASFGYESGQGRYWETYQPSTATYTGSKYKGLHDGMVKAGFTIPVTKAFLIQPVYQYYFPLSADSNRTYGIDPTTGLRISNNPMGYLTSSQVFGVNFVYNF